MLDRLTQTVRASVLLTTIVGSALLAAPLAAQPLQLQPPKPAAAKPAAPRLVLPPPRPPGLGQGRNAATEAPAVQAAASNAPAIAAPAVEAAKPAATPAKSKQAPPATQEEAVERLNAYLNSFTTLQGNFIQHASNGRRLEGRIYIQRPGKMRFEYEPPTTTEVIADGTSVAIRDKRLAPQDLEDLKALIAAIS